MDRRLIGGMMVGLTLLLALTIAPFVAIGEKVVVDTVATAPGSPPSDPSVDDDIPFYNDPYDSDLCGPRGGPHEYYYDEPKESPHSFGPALGQGGSDGAIIDDTFYRLCGEEGFGDEVFGPDRVLGRAISAAAFGQDPNRPFTSDWMDDQRHLVAAIDWQSAQVERDVMSAPGTRSTYMHVDESGMLKVGVAEVKPRLSTYLMIHVYVDEISYVTLRLRVNCGGQIEFLATDKVPAALL